MGKIKRSARLILLLILHLLTSAFSYGQTGWRFVQKPGLKQVDVFFDDHPMTSLCYQDSIMKPVLFPIRTVSGITITRGFPIAPAEGDHVDHPHHTGLWMNYESINGIDFWNNSTAIPNDKKSRYGRIVPRTVTPGRVDHKGAELTTISDWVTKEGTVLLTEKTIYYFSVHQSEFIIDRVATLTAESTDVNFKDVKDGFLGLRVASELEQPSKEPLEFMDANGNVTKTGSNPLATGNYTSSAGLSGDAVWGTRGPWAMLQGKKNSHDVSITILDHPSNAGYPTYWHARGYGLFAANPLGQEIFSLGKEKLNLRLAPHQSVTFRFRIVIAEGKTTTQRIQTLIRDFEKK